MATEPVEIWPENVQAVELFTALGTQWRVGMSGATGLDYNVLFHKMDRLKLKKARYDQVEQDIRTMENAALVCMRKKVSE